MTRSRLDASLARRTIRKHAAEIGLLAALFAAPLLAAGAHAAPLAPMQIAIPDVLHVGDPAIVADPLANERQRCRLFRFEMPEGAKKMWYCPHRKVRVQQAITMSHEGRDAPETTSAPSAAPSPAPEPTPEPAKPETSSTAGGGGGSQGGRNDGVNSNDKLR